MVISSQKGFSLVETVMALGVLTTGVLGAAAILATGMQNLSSSPSDVVITQKAAQAIEGVFSARDSGKLTWAQINNVHADGTGTGIFTNGEKDLRLAGPDGVVNTTDDDLEPIETVVLPGKDQILGTSDDQTITLSNFKRTITLTNVDVDGQLRKIVVTITYQNGPTKRTYVLTSFISAYS